LVLDHSELSTNRCFLDAISANPKVHLDLTYLENPGGEVGPVEEAELPEEFQSRSFERMVERHQIVY